MSFPTPRHTCVPTEQSKCIADRLPLHWCCGRNLPWTKQTDSVGIDDDRVRCHPIEIARVRFDRKAVVDTLCGGIHLARIGLARDH